MGHGHLSAMAPGARKRAVPRAVAATPWAVRYRIAPVASGRPRPRWWLSAPRWRQISPRAIRG